MIALRELALRYTAERVVAEMELYRQAYKIKAPWPAAERIIVCVSPSPLSARLVRSGKRMAEALRAKWTVVYVEGPRQIAIGEEDRSRLNNTLRLAEQLGAETLELSGKNVPDEIVRCAHQFNASKIIIGKPARARWKELLFGSVVDDVVRQSGAIDVYVITGEGNAIKPRRSNKIRRTSKWSSYLIALAQVVLCTLVGKGLLPHLELSNIVMIYLLGVVFVALRSGRGPTLVSSVLSVATFDFFCVPPYLTFAVSDTQYLVTFAVMLVVALVISNLTVTIRQQADAARLRETRTAALYSMSRELSSSLDLNSIIEIGLRHIADTFDSKVALMLPKADGQLALAATASGKRELGEVDFGVAVWVHRNRQSGGLSTDTLPAAKELYVPLLGAERSIGVVAVRPSQPDRFLSPEQHRLLETFANQLALACERAQLSERTEQTKVQMKTEQLRSSLLSSVSHDLRTPLATISGAASSIMEGTKSLDINACKEMAGEIYRESMRMNRLVSNLLDMTKLQSGTLQLVQCVHYVDELVGSALSYLEERLSKYRVSTVVDEDVLAVSVDETLVQQVLVNLLENAIKYTPAETEIEIRAERSGDMVLFSVADRGPGIPVELHSKIFEKFYREDSKSTGGAGLGLAICNGIVEAHGGKIWVENRTGGGAVFKFTLPAADSQMPTDLEDEVREGDADHA